MFKSTLDEAPSKIFFGVIFLLIISISRIEGIDLIGGSVVFLLFISMFILSYIHTGDSELVSIGWIPLALSFIWFIGFVQLIMGENTHLLEPIRYLVYIIIIFVSIMYLPKVIDFYSFCVSIAIVSSFLVVVGLIPELGGPSQIGPFNLEPWTNENDYVPFIDHSIRSIFYNPNHLGIVVTIGSIGSISAYFERENFAYLILFFICLFGVFATQYRTGIIVGVLMAVVYVSFIVRGVSGVGFVTGTGVMSAIVCFLIIFGLVPGPEPLATTTLNQRTELWKGAIIAITESPFIGYGFGSENAVIAQNVPEQLSGRGPHNAFLQMGLNSGIIGAALYIGIHAHLIIISIKNIESVVDISVYNFSIAIVVIQTFGDVTIFGTIIESVLLTTIIGYVLYRTHLYDRVRLESRTGGTT